MNMLELSIIIVSYNTKELLRNCINSIIRNTHNVDYEIMVVDNASSDGSVEMLRKEFPQVNIIANKENLGFAKANNQGIRVAKGENILLLNSDTIVLNNCLHKILEFIKYRPDAGVIGCKVLNQDRTLHMSCYHDNNFLTELIFFTKDIIKGFWDPISFYRKMQYWNHNRIRKVDFICGCFFWVRRKVFDKVGLLDENIFMYYEDAEFCRRVRLNSNYKVFYYPYSQILHLKGASSKHENVKIQNYYSSFRYYFNKYHGKYVERTFDVLCRLIWQIEISIFSLLRFNRKFNKKLVLLKELKKTQ